MSQSTTLKKLTILLEPEVYQGLYTKIGKGKIGAFLNNLAKPHVLDDDLNSAYQQMAHDEQREEEASEIIETSLFDIS